MVGESLIKLRLSIWRDFVPDKALILRQGPEREHRVLAAGSELQEEVYSWQMREDPFSGVSDSDVRERLHKLLVERFEESQPPSKRRVEALSEFVANAQQVISADQAEWTVSQDAPEEDEEVPYRLNPLLALKLHLEWLLTTFAGQPGISVSVR